MRIAFQGLVPTGRMDDIRGQDDVVHVYCVVPNQSVIIAQCLFCDTIRLSPG